MLENGLDICTCRKKKCERHGDCKACIAYHQENRYHALPFCKRKDNKDADKANKKISIFQ